MIIPVKCPTCGAVLADKYETYQERVKEQKLKKGLEIDKVVYLTQTTINTGKKEKNFEKTPEGKVLDELHVFNLCCRRTMLTHVDIY